MTEEGDMSADAVPDWVRPVGGFTALDLDRLPDLPPHTELIDGGLVFVSPQRRFRMRMVDRLNAALAACAPPQWDVAREMSVVLDDRQRPEPDVLVFDGAFEDDDSTTWYPASVVVLVIEVVSPDSEIRDRERKPQLYARAGIRHFWRVEEVDGRPVVYVYELDPASRTYALSGIHHGVLKLDVPFPIEIDLDAAATV